MPLSATDYRPRDAEHAVLYRVIDERLEAFLETAKREADGSSLPGPERTEREKTFAWLLLLLKEHRSAR